MILEARNLKFFVKIIIIKQIFGRVYHTQTQRYVESCNKEIMPLLFNKNYENKKKIFYLSFFNRNNKI